jgi:hypothetical protein
LSVFLANNEFAISLVNGKLIIGKTKLQDKYLGLIVNDRVRSKYYQLYVELNESKDSTGLKKLSKFFDSLNNDDTDMAYRYFKSITCSCGTVSPLTEISWIKPVLAT